MSAFTAISSETPRLQVWIRFKSVAVLNKLENEVSNIIKDDIGPDQCTTTEGQKFPPLYYPKLTGGAITKLKAIEGLEVEIIDGQV